MRFDLIMVSETVQYVDYTNKNKTDKTVKYTLKKPIDVPERDKSINELIDLYDTVNSKCYIEEVELKD